MNFKKSIKIIFELILLIFLNYSFPAFANGGCDEFYGTWERQIKKGDYDKYNDSYAGKNQKDKLIFENTGVFKYFHTSDTPFEIDGKFNCSSSGSKAYVLILNFNNQSATLFLNLTENGRGFTGYKANSNDNGAKQSWDFTYSGIKSNNLNQASENKGNYASNNQSPRKVTIGVNQHGCPTFFTKSSQPGRTEYNKLYPWTIISWKLTFQNSQGQKFNRTGKTRVLIDVFEEQKDTIVIGGFRCDLGDRVIDSEFTWMDSEKNV